MRGIREGTVYTVKPSSLLLPELPSTVMYRRLLELPERACTWLLGLWVRPDVLPLAVGELLQSDVPVCYVLETGGIVDRAALNLVCRSQGLPAPTNGLVYGGDEARAVFVLRRRHGLLQRLIPGRKPTSTPPRLQRLIASAQQNGHPPLQLVPVAIYWGQSPDREASMLKLMFSENWEVAGRTRKFFKALFHGRNTLVQFSEPMALETLTREALSETSVVRKVSRILRVHFRHRRVATLGPDLSHRRTLLDKVLRAPAVRDQVHVLAGSNPRDVSRTQLKAAAYANEIAASLSYPTIRVLRKLLTRIWNRLYEGVRLDGIDRLNGIADGRALVYVPCHRSHIDYLLLSYILYNEGKSLPHIAAGKNLNIPVVGPILRRGGAFFLRRSFRDNRLYGAVFNEYLQEILRRGHSLEYFIEGGRSRTGRLLEPKGGMLAMTAHSYLRNPDRPLAFVPIYFGYERLVEGGSFASELTGGRKQKESLLGFFKSLKVLREAFGSVYVNFGQPIEFNEMLDEHYPQWQSQEIDEERPDWLQPVVALLGHRIQERINAAASVTPISLLSLSMLTSPQGRMAESDLNSLIRFCRDLQLGRPYSKETVMTTDAVPDIVQHGVELGFLHRKESELGGIVSVREGRTIPMSFFRNSVLHLYAIPSLVACCFLHRSVYVAADIQKLARLSYPYLKSELYLRWNVEELEAEVNGAIEQLVDLGVVSWTESRESLSRAVAGSEDIFLLLSIGQIILPSLQRYFLTVSLLSRYGSGQIDAEALGAQCRKCAERLEEIHGMQSPEFYDKSLFRSFIDTLLQQGVVTIDDNGKLEYENVFSSIDSDTRTILGEQIRHSILNITARAVSAADSDTAAS